MQGYATLVLLNQKPFMKKHLLILSFIGLSGAVNAQTAKIFRNSKVPVAVQKTWVKEFNKQQLKKFSASKTTAANERLAADASYADMGSGVTLADSTKYLYSQGRGSQFNFTDMQYDSYSGNGVKADSSFNYFNSGSGLQISFGTLATYNSTNMVTGFTRRVGNPLTNNTRVEYTYDGAGNLVREVVFNWNSNQWDSTDRTDYTYNSQNQMTQSLTYDISSSQYDNKATYTYNSAGDMTGGLYSFWLMGAWQQVFRMTMTYDANHHVITNLSEDYDISGWVNSALDTFGYNGTDFYTYYEARSWDDMAGAWVNEDLETRTLNSQSLPNIQTNSTWDNMASAYVPDEDVHWFYNTNNNPVKFESYSYSGGTPSTIPDYYTVFYYEYYFPQGVNDVSKNGNITVYPNPATETVKVRWNGSMSNSKAAISLTNTMGQVVYNSMQPVTGNETTLSLNGLPTGTYLLSVKDTEGKPIHTQTIVKQ